MRRITRIVLALAITALSALLTLAQNYPEILAEAETQASSRDAAHAPTVWVNPDDASASRVLAAEGEGGIVVYDLQGERQQSVTDFGAVSDIDLRTNVNIGGQAATLVLVGIEASSEVGLLTLDAAGDLTPLASITTGVPSGGLCLYQDRQSSNETYAVVLGTNGNLEQYLLDLSSGDVQARLVRELRVGSALKACVADDLLGDLYVAESSVAIWKYGAAPNSGTERNVVDIVGGGISEQVAGMTIYYAGPSEGYLIASNVSNDSFLVYERGTNHTFLGEFGVVGAGGTDAVNMPAGIAVTNQALAGPFGRGLFVTSDALNEDPTDNANFKLVPWQAVADALNLNIETRFALSDQ